jgi:cell division septum initiation protein DivIVA
MNRDTGEPTDIGRELFGYKKDDVEVLLADLNRDILSAKEELRSCKLESDDRLVQINRLEEIIDKLKTVYENSEKTSTLMIRQAKADAEGILNNAYHAAAEIVEEASIGRKRISGALSQLDDADRKLTESFERIMKSYMSMIDAVSAKAQMGAGSGDGDVSRQTDSGYGDTDQTVDDATKNTDLEQMSLVETDNLLDNQDGTDSQSARYIGLKGRVEVDNQVVADNQPTGYLSEPDIALIKAHLSPIAETDGVRMAWLCDNKGIPLAMTYAEPADISSQSLNQIVVGFSKMIEHLSSTPDSPNMSQAFILVDALGIIIQPISGLASAVVVVSGNTNPAKILSQINEKQERLAHLLSSISVIAAE